MNYLAHFFLSPEDPDWIIGSILGDFVKGTIDPVKFPEFTNGILNGVRLHRSIDVFTDNSDIFKTSVRRISGEYRRFSPILVDMYYDYLLAKHWGALHHEPFNVLRQKVYRILSTTNYSGYKRFLKTKSTMITEDWLGSYRTVGGISTAIERLGGRLKRGNTLIGGVKFLLENESKFENDFLAFIPTVQKYAFEWTNKNC